MTDHLERKLDRVEVKIDTGFAAVNAQLIAIAKTQGEHEGKLKGHASQIGWIWGILSGGMIAGFASLLRAIT